MGHISCPICERGSFTDLKLFKLCVGSVLSRPICCIVCNQTVLGLTSLHVHLTQHETEQQTVDNADVKYDNQMQATGSLAATRYDNRQQPIVQDTNHSTDLKIGRSNETNSPQSDDCTRPETSGRNSCLDGSFESSSDLSIKELQNYEGIPPLDRLDLRDDALCRDLTQVSENEMYSTKNCPSPNSFRTSSRCSIEEAKPNSPHSVKEQHSCDECGLMFSSEHFLVWHKDIIHNHSDCFEVTCKLCKTKFPNLETYRNHVKESHNEQRYLCEKCPKTFKLRGSLVVHKRMYHDGTPSLCQLCNKKFPSDTRRDFHVRRYHANCGKATAKGKFSQDVELVLPLKKCGILRNNSIQTARRSLENLIQKNNVNQPKFTDCDFSNFGSFSPNNSLSLPISNIQDERMSISPEPASSRISTSKGSRETEGLKYRSEGISYETLKEQKVLGTSFEDSFAKIEPSHHSTGESCSSCQNLPDVHIPNLQDVITWSDVEQPASHSTSSTIAQEVFLETSPSKLCSSHEKKESPQMMESQTQYSREKITSEPDFNGFADSSCLFKVVSSSPSYMNTGAIAQPMRCSTESSQVVPNPSMINQTPATHMRMVRSKNEGYAPPTVPAETSSYNTNGLRSGDDENTRSSVALSSNLTNMKNDFNRTHQNQKVGLPAFLGCDGKQWECDVCKKCFTTKYFLKKHKRLHTGETPYTCSECGKTFTFQQSYHKHLLYHSDEKPHVCSYCSRAFKEMSTLHNHVRIHTGEKPFVCETCGKAFRQRVSYLVHQRIHTGVLPYTCLDCEKSFRYKVSLRSHKCEKHNNETSSTSAGQLPEASRSKTDLSEKNRYLSEGNTGQHAGQSSTGPMDTHLRCVNSSKSNNITCLETSHLDVKSHIPCSDRGTSFQDIRSCKLANSDPVMGRSPMTQSDALYQDITSNPSLSFNAQTCSIFATPITLAMPKQDPTGRLTSTLATNIIGPTQSVTQRHVSKAATGNIHVHDGIHQFTGNTKVPTPHNFQRASPDRGTMPTFTYSDQQPAAASGKTVDMPQLDMLRGCNVDMDCSRDTHETEARGIPVMDCSVRVGESSNPLPTTHGDHNSDYHHPVMLTLSSQASDSDEEIDGEVVFRRLFS